MSVARTSFCVGQRSCWNWFKDCCWLKRDFLCFAVALTSFSGWLSRHNSRFCKQFHIIIINKFLCWAWVAKKPQKKSGQGQKVRFRFIFIFLNRKFVSFVVLGGWAILWRSKLYLLAAHDHLEHGKETNLRKRFEVTFPTPFIHLDSVSHTRLVALQASYKTGIYQLFSSNRYTEPPRTYTKANDFACVLPTSLWRIRFET